MEYVYAALILHETGAEINEQNLTGVLESAGETADRSRVKAIVAALEDVDLNATKAKTMAPVTEGGETAASEQASDDEFEADADAGEDEPDASDEDDDSQLSGSLGSLFGESDDAADEDAEPDLEADPGDGEVESTDEAEA